MTDLLEIGASGLRSYRAALQAVGDNVANAQTVGYARRTVRIAEVRVDGAPSLTYLNRVRFDGAMPADVVRATDVFRTQEARLTAADATGAAARVRWLSTAETALGGDTIPTALSTMFARGDTLAADPGGAQPRAAFMQSIADTASDIRTAAGDLTVVASGVGDAATAVTADTNAALASLGLINLMIRRQPPGSATFAELSDQRDQLVDSVTANTGATATLSADGSVGLAVGGATLLTLGTVTPVTVATAADGRLSYAVGGTATPFASGMLAGLADAADTIADRRADLNALAGSVATAINGWQAGGTTPDGRTGPPLLAATSDAAMLNVVTNDPRDVATAQGTVANGNVLQLAIVRGTSGLEATAAQIISRQATTTAAARSAGKMTADRADTAAGARDGVEGVDLDHEAADLVRYQQAYSGAAKVIQAARDTVDIVLALFK